MQKGTGYTLQRGLRRFLLLGKRKAWVKRSNRVSRCMKYCLGEKQSRKPHRGSVKQIYHGGREGHLKMLENKKIV